jgi:hypothetical protein
MRIRVVNLGAVPGFDPKQTGLDLIHIGDLSHYVNAQDGLLIYVPNEDFSQCRFLSAWEVVATHPEEGRITVDMRPVDKIVSPPSRVRHFWRSDPYMPPNKSRVREYRLVEIFAEAFADEGWLHRKLQDGVPGVFRPDLSRPTLRPQSGEVYLFSSVTRGTKIGKSTDVQERRKQIQRDIGEPVEVIHRISSNDYTRAEVTLHKRYWHLNIEFEWFNLSPKDIAEIKSITEMNF